jgi:hypothetical protein
MRLQSIASNQNIAKKLAVLNVQKRKRQAILCSLRAYQQTKPSPRQARAIHDNEKVLADIKDGIARLQRMT